LSRPKKPKKRRIRIQAEQLVKYDQIVEVTEAELKEFVDARTAAEQGSRDAVRRLADLADAWLDKAIVSDAREIEGDEVEIEVL
jgi:hypothetical protein